MHPSQRRRYDVLWEVTSVGILFSSYDANGDNSIASRVSLQSTAEASKVWEAHFVTEGLSGPAHAGEPLLLAPRY